MFRRLPYGVFKDLFLLNGRFDAESTSYRRFIGHWAGTIDKPLAIIVTKKGCPNYCN